MTRRAVLVCVLIAVAAASGFAQTTSTPGIDVEVYNPSDGSNTFCVNPGASFVANVLLRPGVSTLTCTPACGTTVNGGSAALAAGVIDLDFDETLFTSVSAETNPATVAAHGLLQDNTTEGRIGWALVGNWTTPGDPSSVLLDPCTMVMLEVTDWVYRVNLSAQSAAQGLTTLYLRRQTDSPPFALSFADICASPAFTVDSGDIDELRNATVMIADDCLQVIFYDAFESADLGKWTRSVDP
jgi:hypothetical protein